MKKSAVPFLVFTLLGNAITVGAILLSGVDDFLLFWWQTTLKYTLGIVVFAFLWYLLWINRIRHKKEFARLSLLEDEETLDTNADRGLMLTMCPGCEQDCYYFSKDPEASSMLICWSCQHTFSFVWCDRCGMGGDFVAEVSQQPASWECPQCKNTYSLSRDIFEQPLKTVSDKELPASVGLSHLARQQRFQKEQAVTSVWLLASLLVSLTLVSPIIHSVNRALAKLNLMDAPPGPGSPLPYLCGIFGVYLIVLVSTWYGLVFYPLALMRKSRQSKHEYP